MASKYLDYNGLTYLWSKIKSYVDAHSASGASSVVEVGTEGIWKYRKWSDGTAECWGIDNVTSSAWVAWGTGYYTSTYSQPSFPSGLFIEAPVVSANIQSGKDAYIAHTDEVTKDSVGGYYLVRPSNSPAEPYSVGYYANGKWK